MLSKKILPLFVAALCFIVSDVNAQLFISQTFDSVSNPALPSGWSSAPASLWKTGVPNTIMPNALASLNHSLNNAAHTKAVAVDGSQPAVDGAVLSSPVISIPSSATNVVLEYDVAFFGIQNNNNPPETESLIFVVSTNGGATWTDVAFVAPLSNPDESVWDARLVSMSAYAGQNNLKFGFRYNNQGGTLIGAALDNIKLINGPDGAVINAFAGDHPDPSTGTGYQISGSNTTLGGTIQNTGSVTINNYYIKYKVGNGAVQSSSLISTPLDPLATANFPTGLTVAIPANTNYAIKAWIQTTGDVNQNNDTFYNTTVGVSHIPTKQPVFEEGTGTWCGWCPRGAVFMDHFATAHPGAASQIAVHNNDPMMVTEYNDYMLNYVGGFPNPVIDRYMVKDPRSIDTSFATAQNNFGFADFTMDAPVINGNFVSIPVSIKPVVNINNAKLALAVTESNVKGSGSNWPQNNYYSGGGSGIMGGWEQEASHVDDVNFHFVARSISPSAGGNQASLPSTLLAGTTYNATLTTTLNSEWKINDLQYIALLINGNNTAIMNSASTALPTLQPALGNITALHNIDNSIQQALLYPNPTMGKAYFFIKIKDADNGILTITDILGRKMLNETKQLHSGDNVLEIETNRLTPGNYYVNLTTTKATVSLKFIKQ